LYYLHVPNKLFAFASETFSFKFLEGYIRKFDKKNLLLQINDANTLEGLSYTIYENIFQLLPGHYMEIQKNKYPKQKQWWNTLEHLQKVPASYNEQIEKFRELLIRSINLRLRSDVTVATALSGGVDSSSVFCSMKYLMDHNPDKQRIPSDWQQAFIATFPGTSADEKIYAEEIITYTGLKGNFIRLNDENLYERIVSTTIKSDSIIASPILAQCMVYEQMKKSGVKVSMDGHGVDEMLFGYPWLVKAAYNFYKENSDSKNKTDLENTYVDLFHEAERNRIRKELFQEKKSSTGFKRILKNTPIHKLYSSFKKPSALQGLSDKPYNLKNLNSAEQIIFNCFHTSTLPTLLMSFDRASMQNGVEVRMPFMDWQLVTFIFSLPLQSKVGNGCTKRILRDAMRGIVPEKILSRKTKIGLMAPMYDWFNNKISDAIIDELNSNSFLNSEFWNGNELAAYATQKTKSKTWQGMECSAFWNIYNAHLLLKNN
jgi:asparagine synthase (glutamine-hydrolysing)